MARTYTKEMDGLPPNPPEPGSTGDQSEEPSRRPRTNRSTKETRSSTAKAAGTRQRAADQTAATTRSPARSRGTVKASSSEVDADGLTTPAARRRASGRSVPAPVRPPLDEEDDFDDTDLIDDTDLSEPVPYITTSGGRHPAPRLVTILVGLVVVILALSVVFLGRRVLQQNHLNSLRSSALADANQYGTYVSSYDYRNLTAPTSPYVLAEQNATPAFRAKLQSVESSFDSALKQLDSTSSGKVVGAGVSSVTTSQAKAVLFIQQTTSSSVQKKPVTQPLWLQMTLVRQHGKWLISDITADT
jgi:Mce-associated membrane protein